MVELIAIAMAIVMAMYQTCGKTASTEASNSQSTGGSILYMYGDKRRDIM